MSRRTSASEKRAAIVEMVARIAAYKSARDGGHRGNELASRVENGWPARRDWAEWFAGSLDAVGYEIRRKPRDINARLRALVGGRVNLLDAAVSTPRTFDPRFGRKEKP